jgi:trk system potassium uptake protein TrkH
MNKSLIISTTGGLLLFLALAMLLPLLVAGYYGNREELRAFLYSAVVTAAAGALMKFPFQKKDTEFTIREGFVCVVLGWTVCVLFGSLPYQFTGSIKGFTDAYFESMSGFTTTGATVIKAVESLTPGVVLWRGFTQWLGGLGIIVFFIAFLPTAGLAAHHLFAAEFPGPTADRIRPRIAETARLLLKIYILLSLLEILLLLLGGMPAFDTLCHTFSTVSTGGFSSKDASIASYQSLYIEVVISVFMFLGACNFVLYYQAGKGKVGHVLRNPELRFFALLVSIIIFLVALSLHSSATGAVEGKSFPGALRRAAFQVLSIATTTGFTTEDFDKWPDFCRFALILMMLVGGCAGSTAGAIKNIRILLLLKCTGRELVRLVTPRVVKHVKISGVSVEEDVISNAFGFFFLYLGLFGLFSLILSALGIDIVTAFGAVAATMGNVGPGLGGVGPGLNYGHLDLMEKWVLIFCMLLGRLEIYSVILMFMFLRR